MVEPLRTIHDQLRFLYSEEEAGQAFKAIKAVMDDFRRENPNREKCSGAEERFSEEDIFLITYPDQVRSPGQPPLRTLTDFLNETVSEEISAVHLLPFFPYSSDDGFAVKDYRSVNSDLGSWKDVERLGTQFDLMFDAVINHVSRESKWFRRCLESDSEFKEYFIEADDRWDLSNVVRPRDNPLTTEVEIDGETKRFWTTFSSDQIDLNYANPAILLRIVDLLLLYVEHGAGIIRLDAIAYLWKKSGASCIHLEEVHRVVRLIRAALDAVAPDVALITETNVPHEQNVSYFGDGAREAQMVYQFSLPPLVFHTFLTGDASVLSGWARKLEFPPSGQTFFNFLASHDGIGVRPAEGILSDEEIEQMVNCTKEHGGAVSYRADPNGGKSPYELNISYFDALSDPKAEEPVESQVSRFLSSQAIMLAFRGVPGIYFHSLFGSRNWKEGVAETGRKRTINREKVEATKLQRELKNPDSLRFHVLKGYKKLLRVRRSSSAFHPSADQRVVNLGEQVFAILRSSPNSDKAVLCLHSVVGREQLVELKSSKLGGIGRGPLRDIIAGCSFTGGGRDGSEITLSPYEVLWLQGSER